ncbi:hypothetical protein [uncultured Gammaproteobacteria bacterium]|nr:hypothetical protein [uncultured Gammaproteobacteria bacterium]CAC9633714.1 hypothetical protein [uncultured Gammaproteobacteria bacterium]CAC9656219.1 hypothetical protein [uncultured Gammaproteobacteria bacterium]
MWCWIKSSFVDLDGWKNGWFWLEWVFKGRLFRLGYLCKGLK